MIFDTHKEIKKYLENNGILNLPKEKQLIATAKLVASIPWGEGRTVEETLVTKKVGTCQGKHLVLEACLDELGIDYQLVVCTFRWGEQEINFPPKIKKILDEGRWEHGHNFIQIKNSDGNCVG